MKKLRKPHPIVQVARTAATELNDLLNAIGLRVSLLRHQLEASAAEGEMIRLATLVEKASQRVQRLEEYARAEELVASMRPGRATRRPGASESESPGFLSEQKPRTTLFITGGSAIESPIKESLERSGHTVVVAESSADGLKLIQSNDHFDHIVCDSAFLADTGFTAELSRAASTSRVYILHGHSSDRFTDRTD